MSLWPLMRAGLHALPAECAHEATLRSLAAGLGRLAGPRARAAADPRLAVTLWPGTAHERRFPNTLGLAAGFDKDARVMAAMLGFGFGFVEVGTVTPRPQPGNPRPRLFRLPEDRAVINRLGFNNGGAGAAVRRLAAFRRRGGRGIVGVNIGKNKDAADAVADYRTGAGTLGEFADYLVVNVSSPNTPGLRDLQGASELADILAAVRAALAKLPAPPPVLVKIAPDLSDAQLADICVLARDGAMDGLTVSNTTTARPATLVSANRGEAGGLSGKPLFEPATRLLAAAWRETGGRVPLVGVGGVDGPEAAYAKIRAGASLVQLYSALIYDGPGLVARILDGLLVRIKADGFATVSDAVGADHR